MTIEADLFTVLKTVCARVFPDFAPVDTPRPYATYQQIGGDALRFLDPTIPSKKNGHYQISVWGDTRASVAALAILIESALIPATAFQASALSAPAADFDADVPVYGSRQDFSIWSNR
jgi:hypothetical protein